MEINYKNLISESAAPFFTRQNLEMFLGRNRRTLDYRIKSLIRQEILIPLKSGFYVNNSLYKRTPAPLDMTLYIGGALVPKAYVSLEYSMSFYGFLAENAYTFTYVTTQKTRKFQNDFFNFSYKSIKPELFWGYTKRFFGSLSYQMASPAKAVFDFIYLTPLGSGRAIREFLFDSRFNWEIFSLQDKAEFKQAVEKSQSKKMGNILKYLIRENVI